MRIRCSGAGKRAGRSPLVTGGPLCRPVGRSHLAYLRPIWETPSNSLERDRRRTEQQLLRAHGEAASRQAIQRHIQDRCAGLVSASCFRPIEGRGHADSNARRVAGQSAFRCPRLVPAMAAHHGYSGWVLLLRLAVGRSRGRRAAWLLRCTPGHCFEQWAIDALCGRRMSVVHRALLDGISVSLRRTSYHFVHFRGVP